MAHERTGLLGEPGVTFHAQFITVCRRSKRSSHRTKSPVGSKNWWCPSIAWMKGLRSVVSRLLIEPVAKVRGHTIAQQFLHGPHMVRQTCRHSRCDWLPLLG